MHCHLHYKSPCPERHEQSKMQNVLFINIGAKLKGKSGNEHITHAQQFYLAQKMHCLIQISQTY